VQAIRPAHGWRRDVTQQTVGVVGLGRMGLGMAANLAAKGFPTLGVDPSADTLAGHPPLGLVAASDVEALFAACDVVIASLPTADHVVEVVEGEGGFLAGAPAGAVFVDTSTSEASVSRRLAAAAAASALRALCTPGTCSVTSTAPCGTSIDSTLPSAFGSTRPRASAG